MEMIRTGTGRQTPGDVTVWYFRQSSRETGGKPGGVAEFQTNEVAASS